MICCVCVHKAECCMLHQNTFLHSLLHGRPVSNQLSKYDDIICSMCCFVKVNILLQYVDTLLDIIS